MTNTDISSQLEALLFALGRSAARDELAKKLSVSAAELNAAAAELRQALAQRGVELVDDGRELELRTAPRAASLIERIRKEEYAREVGKAGLEALAAVLYRGPLTRAEIDFIRGVNSSQTLRTLTTRGLLRKIQNPRDERSFLYEPTTELLSHLGLAHQSELPEYESVREKLRQLEESYHAQDAAPAELP
jgi:segregation and condensation protein B